jgi:DNA-binding Lrp family transcriptional regulator
MTGKRHDSAAHLDDLAVRVLNRLQEHIPLVPRPYAAVAAELGASEEEVLDRTRAMKETGIIRQLSAIFDTRALGYQSSLVASRYPLDRLEAGAAVVNSHPGVSHNYQRNHDFNLWYTIAVPPGHSLEEAVDTLHRLSNAESTRLLPTLRLFKIGVKLDMSGDTEGAKRDTGPVYSEEERRKAEGKPLSERDIRAIRALQDDLPVCERPFDGAALREGFGSAEEALAAGEDLRERRFMRRFSAILRHREAGYKANGMAVWKASPEECLRAGPLMAGFEKISHCYQRPTYEDWPYSLFSMIHGRTAAEVQQCVDAVRRETGLDEYRVLYSSVEHKKTRVRYFTDDWDAWEREARTRLARLGTAAAAAG